MTGEKATLVHTLICDDVRLELGNKMSLMGLFQNIFLPRFPATMVKFAVLNRWEGQGTFKSEIRIMGPDRDETVRSQPAQFTVGAGGYADNITFFSNVTFRQAGTYSIQVVLEDRVVREIPLHVRQIQQSPGSTGTVN
jgi:hypothetical protein